MEAHSWIIGQIIIDIIMLSLILWFIRFHFKRNIPGQDIGVTFQEPEAILSEMRQISRTLEKNLEEKKELSRHILRQLDEGLKKAEDRYQQIQKIIREYSTNSAYQPGILKDARQARSSVNALLAKGLSRKEIAQHLGISAGEIELLLKLQAHTPDSVLETSSQG
ncbi:MAG: hypothetical protein JRC68_06135 [Deltaproteobacteria bacterium]|nr:hypothetical protein [Deltaproteobacteria bacterium]